MPKVKKRGFTLVELLVVISILAILGTISFVLFKGVQTAARDSRRKADVIAFAKAYETKYSGTYTAPASNDFANTSLPKDPAGNDYYNVVANDGSGYKVCAALDNYPGRTTTTYCNTPASSCFCQQSAQGTINSSSGYTGTGALIGVGLQSITHPSSCDPSGTLDDGLVGYWKFDEVFGTVANDFSNGNNGTLNGGINSTSGKLGLAINVDGVNDFVSIPSSNSINFDYNQDFTLSLWLKIPANQVNLDYTFNEIVNKKPLSGPGGWPYRIWFNNQNASATFRNRIAVTRSDGLHLPTVYSTSLLNDNVWHLVTFTKSGPTLTLYIDGHAENMGPPFSTSTDTTNTTTTSPADLNLGRQTGYIQYFTGALDDFRIYNRGLAATETQSLYSGGSGCAP